MQSAIAHLGQPCDVAASDMNARNISPVARGVGIGLVSQVIDIHGRLVIRRPTLLSLFDSVLE